MIYLGSDHAGYEQKEFVKRWLATSDRTFKDLGAKTLDPGDDYTKFALDVSRAVASNPKTNRGVLFCGSGQGMAMVANKIKGIRAAVCWNIECAKETRQDNDANVLSLASRFYSNAQVLSIIKIFLRTPFSDAPRHLSRVHFINDLEDV